MIVYFKDHDMNVEVPDNMSDGDIKELGQNLGQYTPDPVKAQPVPAGVTPESDTSNQAPIDINPTSEWKPNFFESDVKPFLEKAYGPYVPIAKDLAEQNTAFSAGAAKEFTLGLAPVEKIPGVQDLMKRHPITTALGRIGGGIGSFALTGGLLEAAGLGRFAVASGEAATAIPGVVGELAPRFVPRFIMSAGTFGTHAFAQSTIDEFQKGNIDPGQYGEGLLNETNWGAYLRVLQRTGKETAGGGAIGAVGGIAGGVKGLVAAVGSAGTIGYMLSRWEGGDHTEALLNASIFAGFELLGGYGRDERLAKEAENNVIDSLAWYYEQKNPEAKLNPGESRTKAEQYYNYLSKDVEGFDKSGNPVKGPEAVVTQENALRKLEKFNQAVRQGQISSPPGSEGFTPIEVNGSDSAAPQAPRVPEESLKLIESVGPQGKQIADNLRTEYQRQDDLAAQRPPDEATQTPEPSKPVNVTPPAPNATQVGEVRISPDEQFSPVKMIPASDLKAGQFTVDPRIVKSYVEKIKAGEPIEPMVAENKNGTLEIQDGHHRGEAMMQLGYKHLPVVIVEENRAVAEHDWKTGIGPNLPFPEADFNVDSKKYPDYQATGDFKQQTAEDFARTKSPHTANENDPEFQKAEILKGLGPLKYVKAVAPPELLKLYQSLAGNNPIIQALGKSLMGFLRPSTGTVHLNKDLFKDNALLTAVFSHEIGHLFGYIKNHKLAFGNILGHLAYELDYRKHLIPNAPNAPEGLLTDADRARLKAEAKEILKNKGKTPQQQAELPDNQFDPQAILNVWNRVVSNLDPKDEALLEYIKGLSTAEKKAIIKRAMTAMSQGQKFITVEGVKKFNKQAKEDPQGLADILKDLIEAEIKKRGLFKIETVEKELKALTKWWSPYDDTPPPATMDPKQAAARRKYIEYRNSPEELYAEFVSVMMNSPLKAKQMAPNAYEMFFNYLENNPKVAEAFFNVQQMVQMGGDELQKLRIQDHLEMFANDRDVERQIMLNRELSKKSFSWHFYHGFIDRVGDINKMARTLRAKDPKYTPDSDAEIALNRMGTLASYERYLIAEFENKVYAPAKALGDSPFLDKNGNRATGLDLAAVQMFLDRIAAGDRSKMANPLFTTAETAQEGLDFLRKENPEYMAKVDAVVDAMRKFHQQIFDEVGSKDFFTPQQITTGKQNTKYATFRVTQYADQWMKADFDKQHGTILPIGDPLAQTLRKTVKIAVAIKRNYYKMLIKNTLLKSGLDMKEAKVTYVPSVDKDGNSYMKPNIQEAPSHQGTIVVKEGGQIKAYHVDEDIAEMVQQTRNYEMAELGGLLNLMLGNRFFRGLFIDYNPSFQAANFLMDAMSTWTNNPNLTLPQQMALYWKAVGPKFTGTLFKPKIEFTGPAAKKARGEYDPLVQEMFKAGAFQPTLSQLMSGKTNEDDLLELYMKKHGVLEPEGHYEGMPFLGWIERLAQTLKTNGEMIEAIPKVINWQANQAAGLTEAENVFHTLNYAGTPNPGRQGKYTPVSNAVFLFSNINKEGYRRTVEMLRNKKYRKTFLRRSMIIGFMEKFLMALAAAGLLGLTEEERQRNKRLMDKVPEYHKTNYNILILGETADGKAIYISIPMPHEQRLLGGIFWKMLHHNGGLAKNIAEIASFGQTQLPGVAPTINLAGTLFQYGSTGNAYDSYRGEKILTDEESQAGGWNAFLPMAKWTFNQFGLVRMNVHNRLTDEPLYREVTSFLPGLNRFLRFSDQGESEILHDSIKQTQQMEAQIHIHYVTEAQDSVSAGRTQAEHLEKATPAPEETKLKRAIGGDVSVEENAKLNKEMAKDSYVAAKKYFNQSQIVRSLRAARSDDEKILMLRAAAKMFVPADGMDPNSTASDMLDALRKNKVISPSVARQAKKGIEFNPEEQ